MSQDADDTLSFSCRNDDIMETFSLRAYRYLSAAEDALVYIHCDIRVCLADAVNTTCECPNNAVCDPSSRKRRSLADNVDENVVYTVSSGPYILEADDEEEGEEAEEEEGSYKYLLLNKLILLHWFVQSTLKQSNLSAVTRLQIERQLSKVRLSKRTLM